MKLANVVNVAIAIGLLVIGPLMLRSGDQGLGLLSVFLGLTMLSLSAVVSSQRLSWRRGGRDVGSLASGQQKIAFLPYSSSWRYGILLLQVLLLVLFLSMSFVAGAVPEDDPSRSAQRLHMLGPWMVLFAPFPLLFLLAGLVRKRPEMGLGLGSDGIYHWSWLGCSFYSWQALVGLVAYENRGPKVQVVAGANPEQESPSVEENWFSKFESVRKGNAKIAVTVFAVHPVLVYYALRFYHENPELRVELGTDAGLRRIRQADFPGLTSD
jgi:hypothetical protein